MLLNEVNRENVQLYLANKYQNPRCLSVQEFKEDCNRFKVIKRLLKKYCENGILEERALLNNIILLNNVFDRVGMIELLKFLIPTNYHSPLKTVLLFINIIDEEVDFVGVDVDLEVGKKLREL